MADVNLLQTALAAELRSLGRHLRQITASGPVRDLAHQAPLLDDPLYLSMLGALRALLFVVDDGGRIVYASPTAETILGRTFQSLANPAFDWIHSDDLATVTAFARRLREESSAPPVTLRVRHRDGHWVWLEASVTGSFRVASGAALTVAFARDVSETQEALRAYRDSEERFRAIAENASDLVLEIDGDGLILFANPQWAAFHHVGPSTIVGKLMVESPVWTSVDADDRKALSKTYLAGFQAGSPFECEFRYQHIDGTIHWMHSSARSYQRSDGTTRLVIIGRDVTARVRAQREVAENERRHRVIADATRDLISECDSKGRLIYASPSMEAILGFRPEELVGTTTFAMTHPDDTQSMIDLFNQALEHREPVQTGPYRVQHRDGSWRWLSTTGVAYSSSDGAVRYLSVSKDITDELRDAEEKQRLEEHLLWTQKLESLGVMAGGIAHDFNNLLTPILGDASLALMDLPNGSPAQVRLQRIQKAALRAAALTNQMLAYAGKGPLVVEPVDLSHLVHDTLQLLESAVASRASLSLSLTDSLPCVEGDAGQLTQVLLNLTSNAAEAVSPDKGAIVVRTGTAQVEADITLLGETLVAGEYVVLEISDNGSGMDDATQARIFDPFYSTKFTGRGLGLASALGIVRGHGGSIEVESKPGEGTRVRVLLPTSSRSLPASEPPHSSGGTWRSSGTILVVDDDEGVRELTSDTLGRAGFDVLCAADGREGVEMFRQHANEIRAVLLDRTMPVLGGDEALAEMQSIQKDVRVILVSGYTRERAEHHLSDAGLAAFLQKPFLPEMLLDLLRSVLEEEGPR